MLRNHFITSSTVEPPNYTIHYTADLQVPFIGGKQKKGLTMWETGGESEPLATFTVVEDSFADGYGEWGIKTSNPSCFYGIIKDKNGLDYSMDSGNFHTITGLIFPDYDYDNNYITEIGGPLLGGGEGNSLTDVTLPLYLEYLGEDTFKGSVNLQTIIIPQRVQSIGNNCFKDCNNLTAFCCDALTPPVLNGLDIFGNFNTIPNLKIYVGFVEDYLQNEDWSKYADIIYLDLCVISYKATDRPIFNLNNVTPSSYTYYGYNNGRGFMRFTKEVTAINGKLFSYDADVISHIYLPNTITSIGESAFDGCESLTSIVIPNSVTSIGHHAFWNCSSLTEIVIPNSVTSIEWNVFEYCSSLTSVTISNSVTNLESYVFHNCTKLTSITIPNSVISIGSWAFAGCSSLASVTIGNSVTSIGVCAFDHCSSLISVVIPNSVNSIGEDAFRLCTSLTSVTICNSVKSIESSAFYDCSKLTKTNYIGDIAGWCSIRFTGSYANPIQCSHNFYINDQEIKDLVIPNNVTSIGEYAFILCEAFTSLTIPNSVKSIGKYAFHYCLSLASITYQGTVAQWNRVTLGNGWNNNIPAKVVHCTDGDVTL